MWIQRATLMVHAASPSVDSSAVSHLIIQAIHVMEAVLLCVKTDAAGKLRHNLWVALQGDPFLRHDSRHSNGVGGFGVCGGGGGGAKW